MAYQGESKDGKFRAVVRDSSVLFSTNQLRFETAEDARAYAHDLSCRWTAVQEYAVLPVDVEPDTGGHWSPELVEAKAVFPVTKW